MTPGVFNGKEVAVKVLVSGGSEATFTGDLFESLVSANMHHRNVVSALHNPLILTWPFSVCTYPSAAFVMQV